MGLVSRVRASRAGLRPPGAAPPHCAALYRHDWLPQIAAPLAQASARAGLKGKEGTREAISVFSRQEGDRIARHAQHAASHDSWRNPPGTIICCSSRANRHKPVQIPKGSSNSLLWSQPNTATEAVKQTQHQRQPSHRAAHGTGRSRSHGGRRGGGGRCTRPRERRGPRCGGCAGPRRGRSLRQGEGRGSGAGRAHWQDVSADAEGPFRVRRSQP